MKLQRLNLFLTKSVMAALSVLFVTAVASPVFALGKLEAKDIEPKDVKERLNTILSRAENPNLKTVVEAIFPDGLAKGVSGHMGIGENIGINRNLQLPDSRGVTITLVAKTRDFIDALDRIVKLPTAQRDAALKEVAGAVDALQKKPGSNGQLTQLDRQFVATQLLLVGNSRGTNTYNPRLANRIMTGQVKGEESYEPEGMRHALEILSIAAWLAMESNGAIDDGKAIDDAVEKYAATRTREEKNKMKECLGQIRPS